MNAITVAVTAILRRPVSPAAFCNSRSAGKCDAAPSARGTAGRGRSSPRAARRACAAWRCASWSVYVLDLAWLVLQSLQRRQSGILPLRRTRARPGVPVRATLRAQSRTVLAAQRFHRQREIELFAQQLVQIDLMLPIHTGIEILVADLSILARSLGLDRQVSQIECAVDRQRERLETTAAREFQARAHRADETEPLLVLMDLDVNLDGLDDPIRLALLPHVVRLEHSAEVIKPLVKPGQIQLHRAVPLSRKSHERRPAIISQPLITVDEVGLTHSSE